MTQSINSRQKFIMNDECTIYEVAELQQQIFTIIETNKSIDFDLSGVSRLDASVVQLLLSAKIELELRNLSMSISALSQEAKRVISKTYCNDIGLTNIEGDQHG
jgi:anti-anti-sigma regulatory factor